MMRLDEHDELDLPEQMTGADKILLAMAGVCCIGFLYLAYLGLQWAGW